MADWLKDIFTDGPETKFQQISPAVNSWWDSIEGDERDELIERSLGELTIYLFGSRKHGAAEYARRHSGAKWSDVGTTWSDGTRTEVWLPFKRTPAGNTVVNKWALGHEMLHYLDQSLKLGNPDNVGNKDYYRLPQGATPNVVGE